MKKKILPLILMTFLFSPLCAQSREEQIMKSILSLIPAKYYVIDSVFGNFISKNEDSVVVMCDFISNKGAAKSVNKILVYKIEKNIPVFYADLNIECAYYNYNTDLNDFYKSVGMKQNMTELGKAFKFGWTGDFNDNGITELMLVKSSFSLEGATLEFVEFHDGCFKITLPARDDICFIESVNKKNHSMVLKRTVYDKSIDDYRQILSEIQWDDDSFSYIEKQKNSKLY